MIRGLGAEVLQFDVNDTSNPAWGRVLVDWEVAGATPIDVKLDITFDDSATQSQSFTANQSPAYGSHEFRLRGGYDTASVTLTVTDADGKQVISQARLRGFPVVTEDGQFAKYGVPVVW